MTQAETTDMASLKAWWRAHDDKPMRKSGAPPRVHAPPRQSSGARPMADGVYVDASIRHGITTLGFVVVDRGQVVESFSTSCTARSSGSAEQSAVRLAQKRHAGRIVFCDDGQTCRKLGATYIRRNKNPAHGVAYRRKNFRMSALDD